jgi:hypothetical protein
MAKQKQGAMEVRVILSTQDSNYQRSLIHWMDRVSNATAQVQNCSFILEFFDAESGHVARRIEFGEPTPEMRKLFDFEFGEPGPEAVGA